MDKRKRLPRGLAGEMILEIFEGRRSADWEDALTLVQLEHATGLAKGTVQESVRRLNREGRLELLRRPDTRAARVLVRLSR